MLEQFMAAEKHSRIVRETFPKCFLKVWNVSKPFLKQLKLNSFITVSKSAGNGYEAVHFWDTNTSKINISRFIRA